MVITGHFVDANWRFQKRVLNFVHASPPRRGVDIVDAIYKCLKEWGHENKVFTVSMDNASYNDYCLRFLREIFSRNKRLLCDGKLFCVRCCAHILNLLVQDGLGEIGHIIENDRESVKYINQFEARKQTFSEIVQQLQLGTKKFQEREQNYDYLPTPEEWEMVEKSDIYRVKEILNLKAMDENDFIRRMVKKMKGKFDKYWKIYSEAEAINNIEQVQGALYQLYDEYVAAYNASSEQSSTQGKGSKRSFSNFSSNSQLSTSSGWSKLINYVKRVETIPPLKSELDMYLEEVVYICEDEKSHYEFNALEWWKVNNLKYRVLSKMAAEILAIPISTIASESTFSASGRVIDPDRASLALETVEALICGGDWIRVLHGVKKKQKVDKKPI
ncbi:PREDICTED: zinc finger BED domain-containing protein RICESLEEPER 2-like [Nelumbo nucifera]|uniref:Zinc finger BED domain-containing protein RICESLEEPER 2-like n=1 Tax=Nelumbo nucifera TaxID=4432 RepID=A0A1U7YW16_NELNU|nr:PREDICTED: zinc finger BED domain-containing protein RICESLEEPER 2-like [Nelumbo nucifera]